ncbi:MAG TPA: calcium/proton exchanger [Xanthobacteraceae bacterium]
MTPLIREIRTRPLFWLLGLVPAVLIAELVTPQAHTLLFVLSTLAIVPLAALLSEATESVAARTGDTVGGLLNATLGNLTELVITLAALHAGQYALVKGAIAGAIVTNVLFGGGAALLIGGLKYHVQDYNPNTTRLQGSLLFVAAVALLVPSVLADVDKVPASPAALQKLSLGLSVVLIGLYGLGLVFSLNTHGKFFATADHEGSGKVPWSLGLAFATLAGVTVLVALVSEVFVESVQQAATALGMAPAFVGFIIVPLVGGAAEFVAAFAAAGKNRLDLSLSIVFGSASQIALFVAPVLVLASYFVGPTPMDLQIWSGAVTMIFIATIAVALVTSTGWSAWFIGALVATVYLILAMALYVLPPQS